MISNYRREGPKKLSSVYGGVYPKPVLQIKSKFAILGSLEAVCCNLLAKMKLKRHIKEEDQSI